ncbi:HEAT repeat domain-containing protein [Actinomadura sp. 6N118]|uniref:HEAT repeat domain-containing protein n=1 Tax=Actinomadura sp. 6N118 TaxID=3375151 RepID=UPI00379EA92E
MGDASDLVYGLELIAEDGPERYAESDLDVRAVVARIPQEVKDELRYDQIPWDRFPHAYGPAVDVPEYLKLLRSLDARTAERAVSSLENRVCHQGGTFAPAALAVPFLLRLASSSATHHRGEILRLVGEVARREHYGDGSRAGLLQVAYPDDQPRYDVGGYLENWSVQAARIAITCDTPLLLALLDDLDADVRSSACYALATALHDVEAIDAALRRRLSFEEVPAVRMSLTLAIAQLAREHRDESTITRLRTWWSDPDRPTDIRVSAALAWLCLVDVPVPDDLRPLLTTTVNDELAELLAAVPWMKGVDWGGAGLRRCIYLMLNPEVDWRAADQDPWAGT